MEELALSVVVPCYNEQEGLPETHRRVSTACHSCVGASYELIFVNDGSQDSTWRIMKTLSSSDPHLVAVNLSRNFGHQLALSAGLQICRGQRTFILDADMQDPPELLPQMMAALERGCDVVFGQRVTRQGETAFKRLSAYLFYRLLGHLSEVPIPADTGDFRLMTRRAVDILNRMPEHHRFIRGMVSWIGLRQEALPYVREPRFAGQSHYPLAKMLRFAADAITSFSVRPLRIASYLGFFLGAAALFLLVYVFTQYLEGQAVRGWTSLAVIVLMLGAAQMLVVGVMSEYLGRLYLETKNRPLYVIAEILAAPVLPHLQAKWDSKQSDPPASHTEEHQESE